MKKTIAILRIVGMLCLGAFIVLQIFSFSNPPVDAGINSRFFGNNFKTDWSWFLAGISAICFAAIMVMHIYRYYIKSYIREEAE